MSDPQPPGEGGEPQDELFDQVLLISGGKARRAVFAKKAALAEEAGREKEDAGQKALSSPLYKKWVRERWARLINAFGSRLAVVLVALAGVLLVGLAVGGVGLVAGLIWYLTPIFSATNELSITERKDLVQGFASVAQAAAVGLTGAAGFIGLALTWRNLRQTRESTQRTLELTERGQITERFTRAIDQLGATDDEGSPRLEVRLGGIYALERIDKESPERAYHSTVIEVLTAYVRENAPWPAKSSKSPEKGFIKPPERDSGSNLAINDAAAQDEGVEQGVEPTSGPPRTDIQAVLDVLKRREEDRVPEKHRVLVDLRGTDLQEANLYEADLYQANLDGANLFGANLERAVLYEADLQKADLHGANLRGADLKQANLSNSYLEQANLVKANLEGAGLAGSRLQQANLGQANLKDAFLERADLEGAALLESDLKGANLYGANLKDAFLERADLQKADLRGAIELTSEQIGWAIGDENTKLPDDLVDARPKAWNRSVEAQLRTISERLRQKPKDG